MTQTAVPLDQPITAMLLPATGTAGPVTWLPAIMMVVGVVLLGLIFTFSIRGRVVRRERERPSPRERIERLKASSRERERVESQEAELQEVTQRLAAQINNRAERLEQLLAEADEKITALEARLAEARSSGAEADHPVEPAPPSDPLTAAVYELADCGRSPLEIAHELDEQVGKVELILALRRAG